MRKIKALIAAAVMSVALFGSAPASASTCAEEIEDVCRVAAQVVCKVLAKGQPCLM